MANPIDALAAVVTDKLELPVREFMEAGHDFPQGTLLLKHVLDDDPATAPIVIPYVFLALELLEELADARERTAGETLADFTVRRALLQAGEDN